MPKVFSNRKIAEEFVSQEAQRTGRAYRILERKEHPRGLMWAALNELYDGEEFLRDERMCIAVCHPNGLIS